MRRFISILCALMMVHSTAGAQIAASQVGLGSAPANEFFVGRELGKPLVTVNLISGVSRPGVYHIPTGTDLAGLIAYAGGTLEKSDLTDISIRRNQNGQPKQESVNLAKLASGNKPFPQMSSQDVVFIPPRQTLDNTLTWVTLVASIASVALSVALIHDIDKRQ